MADILREIDLLVDVVYQEFNKINNFRGDLNTLTTSERGSLVDAINELQGIVSNLNPDNLIQDSVNSSNTKTWSINRIKSYTSNLVSSIFIGVPEAYNNLVKISTEIENLKSLLENKVSYNKDDSKSDSEKSQARSNIGASSQEDFNSLNIKVNSLEAGLGDPDFDLAGYFDSKII